MRNLVPRQLPRHGLVVIRAATQPSSFPVLAADVRTPGTLIFGADQLWIPECVSVRPGTPGAGFIAPAPVAACFQIRMITSYRTQAGGR